MLLSIRILLIGLIASALLLGNLGADEVSELTARIEALEAARPCESIPCTCESGHEWIQAGCEPGSLFFPSTCTTVKFGGYVKLDAIYDFQDAGN